VLPARRLRFLCSVAKVICILLFNTTVVLAQASSSGEPTSTPAAEPAPNPPRRALPATGSSSPTAPALLPAATEAAGAGSADTDENADDQAPLAGDETATKPPPATRWLLLGAGVGTTALWWAGAVGIGELWPEADYHRQLRIPVAGPFIDLAHTGCPAADPSCSTTELVVRTIMVSLDAIGQLGGVALMLEGATLSTASVESPRAHLGPQQGRTARALKAIPVPWLDARGAGGIGIIGRF
jgi:hypothetical protein